MCVSVSNLHFPQMKLESEKSPEAVLEGGNFPGGAWRLGKICFACHPSLLLWKSGQTGFFLLSMALHKLLLRRGRNY